MEYQIFESDLKNKGRVEYQIGEDYILKFTCDELTVCYEGGSFDIPSNTFPELKVVCDNLEVLCQEIQDGFYELEEPNEDEFDDEDEFNEAITEWESAVEEFDDLETSNSLDVEASIEEYLDENLEELMTFIVAKIAK